MNRIVHDPRTYVESIGKLDNGTVRDALADEGQDTVLRICIGASTGTMPLRSLGYAASALAVQEHYFPQAQLQFVHPLHAAEAANALPVSKTQPEAERFEAARLDLGDGFTATGLIDRPYIDENFVADVARALSQNPDIAEPLETAASAREGDSAVYLAAHLMMHDSNAELVPLDSSSPQPLEADRIISIGAQSERKFYLARMLCKRLGVLPPDAALQTGQLFTRHVLPPYLQCREGEPTLDDFDTADINIEHPVASVSRDLEFLRAYLSNISLPLPKEEYAL